METNGVVRDSSDESEPISQRASQQSSVKWNRTRIAPGHAIIEQQQSETILSRQAQAIERQRFKGILHQSKSSKSLWYQQELTSALLAAPGTLIREREPVVAVSHDTSKMMYPGLFDR